METILIIIGVAVVALWLGYLFLKNYNTIDRQYFGMTKQYVPAMKDGAVGKMRVVSEPNPDYETFGRVQVLASAVLGAMLTGIPILNKVFYFELNEKFLLLVVVLVLLVVFSFNLFQAIARMQTVGARVGKFFFLTVACAIGAGFGALGSMVVFAAVVFYIIFLALRIAVSETPDSKNKTQPGGCKYRKAGWCTQIRNSGNRCPYHGGFEGCEYIHY